LNRAIMAGLVAAMVGASFQFGYNVGNMNAPSGVSSWISYIENVNNMMHHTSTNIKQK